MTPLLKEPEQQEVGKNQPKLGPLSLMAVLEEALTDFWTQTFLPAGHLLSQTVSVLWLQVLIPTVQKSFVSMRERIERLAWTVRRPTTAPTMQVKDTSEMDVYKIHGALGERWASEGHDRPIRVNMGKQNPWVAAEKKVVTMQPTRVQPEIPGQKPGKVSTVFALDEIRGLDDIFTSPVQGSFVDVLAKPKKADKALQSISKQAVIKPEAGSAPRHSHKSEAELVTLQASVKMQALARKQVALREESQKLKSRVKNIAESTKDWFTKNDVSSPDTVLLPPLLADVASFTSYVNEDVGETALTMTSLLPPTNAEVASVIVSKPVSRPETSRTKPAKVKPSELTYELAEDLSGFDYMIQNNRILSKSISNLVDSYFHQAALEKEPNYY